MMPYKQQEILQEKQTQLNQKYWGNKLLLAVLKGHTEIVKLLLLDERTNINTINAKDNQGHTALLIAALKGQTDK